MKEADKGQLMIRRGVNG